MIYPSKPRSSRLTVAVSQPHDCSAYEKNEAIPASCLAGLSPQAGLFKTVPLFFLFLLFLVMQTKQHLIVR